MNGKKAPSLAALFPAIREAMEIAGSFELTATGASMEPFLRGGRDQVELVLLDARPVRRGDIVLFQRDSGAFVLHRVRDVDKGGHMLIVGDAQFACEPVRRDQLRALVKSCVRNGRRIDCERGIARALLTARMLSRARFPRATRLLLRILGLIKRLLNRRLKGAAIYLGRDPSGSRIPLRRASRTGRT